MPLGSFGVRRCSEPSRGLRGGARVPLRPVLRSPLRSYRPAPIIPSTSASISNCSTASATARRKSPSPVFSSSSANPNLSSVIGSSPALQVKVLQLHLSRSAPMTTSTPPQPTLRIDLKTPPRAWTLTYCCEYRLIKHLVGRPSVSDFTQRMEFYAAMVEAGRFSGGALKVAFILLYRHLNGRTGRCDPAIETLAEKTRLTKRGVQNA